MNGNAYIETASVVSMLMTSAFYDGMEINRYENMRHESAGVRYLRHDMIFLPICTSVKHWYVAVIDATKQQVHVLESMETTVKDHSELKLVLQGVDKCVKLAMDIEIHFPYSWTDLNVTNWDIGIRYLARKKDRTSSGLFIIKFMEYWNGVCLTKKFFQEDIDEYRKKLAAILYNSPSNSIRDHTEAISEEI